MSGMMVLTMIIGSFSGAVMVVAVSSVFTLR